jgi:hypothetical protein
VYTVAIVAIPKIVRKAITYFLSFIYFVTKIIMPIIRVAAVNVRDTPLRQVMMCYHFISVSLSFLLDFCNYLLQICFQPVFVKFKRFFTGNFGDLFVFRNFYDSFLNFSLHFSPSYRFQKF